MEGTVMLCEVSLQKVKADAEELLRSGGFYCSEAFVSSIKKNLAPEILSELVAPEFAKRALVIAIAFKSANAFLVKNGFGFFSSAPKISEWVAIFVVVYVLSHYAAFLFLPYRPGFSRA
jgi:hypothetical protein